MFNCGFALQLTLENEELLLQLRVVRDCQNELASELVDYKDKYAEILEVLREMQEQLKQQNKKNLPTARSVTSSSFVGNPPRISSYNPDSLASELELSSLGSDGWTSSSNCEFSVAQNLPRYCTMHILINEFLLYNLSVVSLFVWSI